MRTNPPLDLLGVRCRYWFSISTLSARTIGGFADKGDAAIVVRSLGDGVPTGSTASRDSEPRSNIRELLDASHGRAGASTLVPTASPTEGIELSERTILPVSSERGSWVFTYVRAGQTIDIRDKDAGMKPLVKDYDVVQGHVVTQDDEVGAQFMAGISASRFLSDTEGLNVHATARYFRVPKDSIPVETLRVVRAWVKQQAVSPTDGEQ